MLSETELDRHLLQTCCQLPDMDSCDLRSSWSRIILFKRSAAMKSKYYVMAIRIRFFSTKVRSPFYRSTMRKHYEKTHFIKHPLIFLLASSNASEILSFQHRQQPIITNTEKPIITTVMKTKYRGVVHRSVGGKLGCHGDFRYIQASYTRFPSCLLQKPQPVLTKLQSTHNYLLPVTGTRKRASLSAGSHQSWKAPWTLKQQNINPTAIYWLSTGWKRNGFRACWRLTRRHRRHTRCRDFKSTLNKVKLHE